MAAATTFVPAACNKSASSGESQSQPSATAAPNTSTGKIISGDTFFVASDPHFGVEGIASLNKRQIEAMNNLPGVKYPNSIGGEVNSPSFVLICGDLTDKGKADEYEEYCRYYGPGKDALLRYPVYDCTGNHDQMTLAPIVAKETYKKNDGALYSLNLGDLHIACLDVYPSVAACKWLAKDLAANHQTPTILFFHYSITGPYSEFWSDKEKENFAQTIKGQNIAAIFHGHYHVAGKYKWNGIDVFNPGSVRYTARIFIVARVGEKEISIACRDWDKSKWLWSVKIPYKKSP